jgi:hypothetical protein
MKSHGALHQLNCSEEFCRYPSSISQTRSETPAARRGHAGSRARGVDEPTIRWRAHVEGRGARPGWLTAEAGGALIWCLIVILALVRRPWLGPLEIVFLVAPLVHVPLGFSVVQRQVGEYTPIGRVAHSLLPFAAVLAAASF